MLADKLRKSVLQSAIQGKLTEQLATDDKVEDLLKAIKEEKERLIKEKKIKKQKPLPEITEEEIPFEIPKNWKWVRLGEIVLINPRNKIDDDIEVSFIPMNLIEAGYKNKYCYEKRLWKNVKSGFTHIKKGDLGIAKITPCFQNRKSAIFDDLINEYGAGTTEINIIRKIIKNFSMKYLLWFVKTEYFINGGVKSFTGTAGQQRINKDYLKMVLVPLPPLAEQKRIVEKLDNILANIDELKANEEKLSILQKNFPDKLKKSILQSAIQGNLTEQLATDDKVEDLLKAIKEEKERLIKEKKIKKQKPLPEITEEEIPFEIPKNWKWVRANDILDVRDGTHDTPKYVVKGVPLVTSKNLDNGKLNLSNIKYISKNDSEKINLRSKVNLNDILFAMIGTIGNPVIIKKDIEMSIKNIGLFKSYRENAINMDYIYYLLLYMQDILKQQVSSGVQKFVSLTELRRLMMPLPPLAEQKRIVEKLDKLLADIEELKIE
ncbi:restriction endonuclease subunit S [Megamonas hypermegale]|uniref:restriction endonuclease subunit S n=1 Tax=Megamonas hypermegale TaxID=158847 RepID=UPI003209783B